MTKKQLDLLMNRLIIEPQKHRGIEPISIKENKDIKFCNEFFMKTGVDHGVVELLLKDAINAKNNLELDLILMLLAHFNITKDYDLILSSLLIQPWHSCHDRIASILEFDKNEETIEFLYLGALYRCDNLEYESDYYEFNRKCLYALKKIGTEQAINYIKKVANCDIKIVSNYAQRILKNDYN